MDGSKKKIVVFLLISVVILFAIYYVDLNKNTKIYSSESNITFFEIIGNQIRKAFLNSTICS